MNKLAYIRKIKDKYRVFSEKGKNLGTYSTKAEAIKRLKQIEYFKHKKAEKNTIDLTKIDNFSLSAVMRKLNQQLSQDLLEVFLKEFKKNFDEGIVKEIQQPERIALIKSLIALNKEKKIVLPKKLVKNAAITELQNADKVGEYLSNIVKFTLNKISPARRPLALLKMKQKFLDLDEKEIAGKNMPASSSMGQAITFVKHVLFNHQPEYIRQVLDSLARRL